LTIPVMGNETLMHDLGISTQRLISGATDLLRANARFGTTQVLKMAHFAEMYDTNVELNAEGGLFGLVHAHLGCCIDNTGFYETGGHGFVDPGTEGYHPHTAKLAWPLVVDFMDRELDNERDGLTFSGN
jgi:L-alanine-DL-glutamate epimerase-like enolase superfamily enzyme